jgi:hypothetical protein
MTDEPGSNGTSCESFSNGRGCGTHWCGCCNCDAHVSARAAPIRRDIRIDGRRGEGSLGLEARHICLRHLRTARLETRALNHLTRIGTTVCTVCLLLMDRHTDTGASTHTQRSPLHATTHVSVPTRASTWQLKPHTFTTRIELCMRRWHSINHPKTKRNRCRHEMG